MMVPSWNSCIFFMSDSKQDSIYEHGCDGDWTTELESVIVNDVEYKYPVFYLESKCLECPHFNKRTNP